MDFLGQLPRRNPFNQVTSKKSIIDAKIKEYDEVVIPLIRSQVKNLPALPVPETGIDSRNPFNQVTSKKSYPLSGWSPGYVAS